MNMNDKFTASSKAKEPNQSSLRFLTSITTKLCSYKMPMLAIFLTQFGILVFSLTLPAITKILVDDVVQEANIKLKWPLLIAFISLVLIGAFTYIQMQISTALKSSLQLQLIQKNLWKLLKLPHLHQDGEQLAYQVSSTNAITQEFFFLISITLDLLFIPIYAIVIAANSYYLSLIVLFGIFGNLLLLLSTTFRGKKTFSLYQEAILKENDTEVGILKGMETIKSMGMEKSYFRRLAGYATNAWNSFNSLTKRGLSISLNGLVFVAFISDSGLEIQQGNLTPGLFTALLMLLAFILAPLIKLQSSSLNLHLLAINCHQLWNLLLEGDKQAKMVVQQSQKGSASLQKLDGRVEIRSLTFGYDVHKPAIVDKVDLNLYPGNILALTGATGSGKSTIALLMAGLIQPWQGNIYYDGIPIDSLPRERLTNSLALVEQTPFFFKGSLKDNLSFFNPLIRRDDLIAACEAACIHEEILDRPGGYELALDDNATNLSFSQRYRLEIARALLKFPSIIIMDDAASYLDVEVEKCVLRQIHKRGCATLIITNRKESLQLCDRVCVLQEGSIKNVETVK